MGNHGPVGLPEVLAPIGDRLGRNAGEVLWPRQPGAAPATYADTDDRVRDAGFRPATPLKTGIGHFVDWYRTYHGV